MIDFLPLLFPQLLNHLSPFPVLLALLGNSIVESNNNNKYKLIGMEAEIKMKMQYDASQVDVNQKRYINVLPNHPY